MQEDLMKKQAAIVKLTIEKAVPTISDLAKGMASWLLQEAQKNPKIKVGKQSLESLAKSGGKISDIPINSSSIRSFESIAKLNGISFSIEANKGENSHTVYFRAADSEKMAATFKEFLAKETAKGQSKQPEFKETIKTAKKKSHDLAQSKEATPNKNKDKGQEVD